jgi:Bacterial PH domain
MASPDPSPPVIYRPTRGQRGQRLFAGICCVTAGIGIIVFHGRAGAGGAKLIIAGVALAALGIWFLAARRGRTIIDDEGVRTRSAFGQRSCRWSEVTDVELCIDANDGPPMVSSIKIHRAGGGSFTLPAPTDSARKGRHDNPDFADQLATITSYWQATARPPQSGQP